MNILDFNNSIVILQDSMKDRFLKMMNDEGKLLNIKVITLSEFKKKYFFDYDNKAVHHVVKKYGVIPSVAKIYLENLYYVVPFVNKKVDFLIDILNDLKFNNLLTFNPLFKEFFNGKKVILYNLCYVDKFYNKAFDELRDKCEVISYDEEVNISGKKNVYRAKNSEEEVLFVAEKISKLLLDGVSINNIKIYNIPSSYIFVVNKIFKLFNICIDLPYSSSLSGSLIVNKFKELYSNDMEIVLNEVQKYVKNDLDKKLYDKLVNIVNKYAWCDSYEEVKDLLFLDIDNIHEIGIKYVDSVKVVNELYSSDEEYIFVMNFNEGVIPVNYKDEDYLNDGIKRELGISDSEDLNRKVNLETLNKIFGCKNIVITCSHYDNDLELYLSSLFSEEYFDLVDAEVSYEYSNAYNKLKLVCEKDEFYKFGSVSEELKLLNSTYDEEYLTYDNKFKGVDKEVLNKKLNDKLSLSYSSMNTYYLCAFRYYLDNVLRVNKFDDSFDIVIGNIFHKILSECFEDDEYDVISNYEKCISESDYEFNNCEKYFLEKLKSEIVLIIDTIKNQLSYTQLNKSMYEKEINVVINENLHIRFKGFVDKILYNDDNEEVVVAVIDYKTGDPELKLDNAVYGLNLQLPVYLYLIKNSDLFPKVRVGGFYLQNILNMTQDMNERLKSLRLQGYTNSDLNILSMVDSGYEDSQVIRSMKTTSEGLSKNSKVISDEEITELSNIVHGKIVEASENIINGKFDINPKKIGKDNLGCNYCKYKDICFMKNDDILELEKPDKLFGGEEDAKMD